MGNSAKGLTKVQVDNISSLSLIHWAGHLVIEGDQVGQAGPAFHEAMLGGPDPLAVLHMPVEHTQEDALLLPSDAHSLAAFIYTNPQ